MFETAFAGSPYHVEDLQSLGPAHRDAHYTHSISSFFREGGGSPPMWARSRGVDSVLLGITFMQERLGVYVRQEDPAADVRDLRGRRLALPVWPRLVFNFWRFAAEKGLHSALRVHDMASDDVHFVDVEEGWDPHERRQVGREDAAAMARCEYRGQLEALLDGTVDAIFGKGPEAALLEHEGGERIRLLYDLSAAPALRDRVNNSTPRLFTTSRALLREHRPAVVRYLATALRAANWAGANPDEARILVARECAVPPECLDGYLQSGYLAELRPGFEAKHLEAAEVMQAFLYDRGYLETDFDLQSWAAPDVLDEAVRLERDKLPPDV
jgi:ABC-type nitrate/sulfonate/bicarbonate transport system substrate-binding protein